MDRGTKVALSLAVAVVTTVAALGAWGLALAPYRQTSARQFWSGATAAERSAFTPTETFSCDGAWASPRFASDGAGIESTRGCTEGPHRRLVFYASTIALALTAAVVIAALVRVRPNADAISR